MDHNDIDKLKLLANSTDEYIAALVIKLRDNAIKNGHDLAVFDENTYTAGPSKVYWAHCRKCLFEIDIEYFISGGQVYFDLIAANKKCLAKKK